jgi:signal transduction histidine kinase
VTADPDGLSQVVLNLLMNAMAAVPPHGQIDVDLQAAPAPPDHPEFNRLGVELKVRDTGQGIPPDVLPRVFEPFFSTKPGEGTGLGLTISRDIVREHEGSIRIESQLGAGTSVSVWLPALDGRVR